MTVPVVASTDLYALLGVDASVSTDDLKKAYRRLARELHPDANPGDATAEARFKEVSQAYEILSDPEKRANYDRFGSTGFEGGFTPGSVQDIFDLFFGGLGGQGAPRRRGGPQSGPDAEVVMEITLEEAAFGVSRELPVTLPVHCESCLGEGAAPGTTATRCEQCQGTGELRRVRNSFLGQMMTSTPCPVCRGVGEIISDPCESCHGDGRINAAKTLSIQIPAGVENGSTMRLSDLGPAGARGGPNGTLYVHLRVADDERFERAGDDLHHEATISFTQAVLGASIEVPTLRETARVEIPAGSAHGTVLPIRHEGVHHLRGRGRGDLYVHLAVDVPTSLDETSEDLLRQLAAHRGEEVQEVPHGLLSRLRGAKR